MLLVGLGQQADGRLFSDGSAGAQTLVACYKALLPGFVPSVEGIILLNSSGGTFLQIKS